MGTSVYKATQLNTIDYKDIHIIYLIVLLLHKAKKETSPALIIFTHSIVSIRVFTQSLKTCLFKIPNTSL